MFRISRLHEVMKGLPRGAFDRIVAAQEADKYAKGFGCWDQLLAMVYAQLSGATSLRVLETGFNAQGTHHYHLGTAAVRRSTLADALARRKTDAFAEAARWLMAAAGRRLRREGTEFLCALDSTSITLKGPGFDAWTRETRTRHTQGMKLHVLYEHETEIPVQHSLTAPNVNDIDEGVKLPITPGAVYVFDKGYCDYRWWDRIDREKAQFVTRFKRNAALRVERARPLAEGDAGVILNDEIVRFANKHPRGGRTNPYQQALRRVTVARPDHDTPLVLATNDLDSPAAVIARRYRERWAIELFFKWIKQHLRIKRFLGRSENAVRLQVLTALITYLLLALYRQAQCYTGSLATLLTEVRATLFQRPGTEAACYRRRVEARAEVAARQGVLFG